VLPRRRCRYSLLHGMLLLLLDSNAAKRSNRRMQPVLHLQQIQDFTERLSLDALKERLPYVALEIADQIRT
jgi:hypothetical protein